MITVAICRKDYRVKKKVKNVADRNIEGLDKMRLTKTYVRLIIICEVWV